MKKLVKMLMLMLLMLVMTLTNSGVVKAEDSDVEFIDFNYSSTKIRENGKIKVRFSCNWETEEYVIVTGLSYKIHNQSADIYGTKLPKGNKHHIDFVIESSIVTDLYGNGINHTIWVHDRFYSKDFTKLEIAKIRYCLYQVMEFFHVSYVLDSAYCTGDVNEDGKFTAMDAAFLARKLAEQKVDELPETADVNGDGEITALDCAEIAKFLAAQAMAKAEGMFVEQQ